MNRIFLIAITALLASCAFPKPTAERDIAEYVTFYGPSNDLIPEQDKKFVSRQAHADFSGSHILKFALTHAVKCNKEKSECKHAIVKTSIELNTQSQSDQSIVISGVLHSEMGRSLSLNLKVPGYTSDETQTISESVAVIREARTDDPFRKKLTPGEPLELNGLADTRVVIEFQRMGSN